MEVEPPTTGAVGVEWRIQGDDNRNASVAVAWRRTGETAWRDGLPLLRLRGESVQQGASFHYVAPNMFAGSVFDLEPNTSYDIRLRLTDPDAPAGSPPIERMVTARTRRVPTPATGGAVYHVYPRDYTGTKLEPNFNSLMAAYNTGANGAGLGRAGIGAGRSGVWPAAALGSTVTSARRHSRQAPTAARNRGAWCRQWHQPHVSNVFGSTSV